MSKHATYRNYTYFTMEDIEIGLQNITFNIEKDCLLDQVIGMSQKSSDESHKINNTLVIVRAPTGSTIQKISPTQENVCI